MNVKILLLILIITGCTFINKTSDFNNKYNVIKKYIYVYYKLPVKKYYVNKIDSINKNLYVSYLKDKNGKLYKTILYEKILNQEKFYDIELEVILTKGWVDYHGNIHVYNHNKECQFFDDSTKVCLEKEHRELYRVIPNTIYNSPAVP